MRKYLAIGHWNDSKNTTCVAARASSIKNFRDDLGGNGFIPYVILTEKKFEAVKACKDMELWNMVKKMTSNYRKWNEICDYIEQCLEIMEERFAAIDQTEEEAEQATIEEQENNQERKEGEEMKVETLVEAMSDDMKDTILYARVYNASDRSLGSCAINTLIDRQSFGARIVKRFAIYEDMQTGLNILYITLADNYETEGTPETCADVARQIEAWENGKNEDQDAEEMPEEMLEEMPEEDHKTVHGYTLLDYKMSKYCDPVALIDRGFRGELCQPWVVAWNYDKGSDTWGQGHYFTEYADAVRYFETNY